MPDIAIESADADGVLELLQASDEFHNALYPPEENYLLDVAELLIDAVTVVVARVDGEAVGMGALVETSGGAAELKRMFVRPEQRGLGIAGGILDSLERRARERAVTTVQLETGPLQPAAIAFYTARGYRAVPAFAPYLDATNSLFFAKQL